MGDPSVAPRRARRHPGPADGSISRAPSRRGAGGRARPGAPPRHAADPGDVASPAAATCRTPSASSPSTSRDTAPSPTCPFRLADASAMVGSVIDDAGGRAIVVGQSLGAYVGMDLAARPPGPRGRARPRQRLRRAALDRPAGAPDGGLVPAGGRERAPPRPRRRDEAWTMRPTTAAGREPARSTGRAPPATNGWLFKGGTRALVAALGETFIPRLAAYPGPTLLSTARTITSSGAVSDAFLAAAVDGRLEVIPGCGHLVSEDQPAAFNAAVRRFAAEVYAASAAPAPA